MSTVCVSSKALFTHQSVSGEPSPRHGRTVPATRIINMMVLVTYMNYVTILFLLFITGWKWSLLEVLPVDNPVDIVDYFFWNRCYEA